MVSPDVEIKPSVSMDGKSSASHQIQSTSGIEMATGSDTRDLANKETHSAIHIETDIKVEVVKQEESVITNTDKHQSIDKPDVQHNIKLQMSVSELKKLLLSGITLEKKNQIKQGGRPMPPINFARIMKSKSTHLKRDLKRDIYGKNNWICGCNVTRRLYCFPCLLFAKDSGESCWVNTGVTVLSNLTQKIKLHKCAPSHINSVLEYNLLGKRAASQQLDSSFRLNIKNINKRVSKNHCVFSKIIDSIIFCDSCKLALKDNKKRENSPNSEIFQGVIDFSADLDSSLKDHFAELTVFKETSKEIQDDLLDCMLAICQNRIKKEIKTAGYVSLIVNEIVNTPSTFILAIVFRYTLPYGHPVERFWQFINPSRNSAVSIAVCIMAVLQRAVDNPKKVISQSYVGTSLINNHRRIVQEIIRYHYKNAFCVYNYTDRLDSIVIQTTSQHQQVRIFFANLNEITNFFDNSSQKISVLDEIISEQNPNISAIEWNFKSRLLNTVHEYRIQLIECAEKIESSSMQSTEINQAGTIRRMLVDGIFVFWLTMFHNIMPHVDNLYDHLQKKNKNIDAPQTRSCIETYASYIKTEREKIDEIRMHIGKILSEPSMKRRTGNIFSNRSEVAREVCDTIYLQIMTRFTFKTYFSAESLFDAEQFHKYETEFPYHEFEQVTDVYSFLNKYRLKNELLIIYKQPHFRNMQGIVSLLQFVIENTLQKTFSETRKLLMIVSTIPMITAEKERCFSTMKYIETFSKNVIIDDKMSALAMLSIEQNMISNMLNFNKSVINLFASEKKRSIEFSYKDCT